MFDEKLSRLLHDRFCKITHIPASALPEIELYMDQVTTFMDDRLKNLRRHPEDKILTKTMINNYTKNQLFPPPRKKKYTQDHLVTLIYTYYLKNILSISDIHTLTAPMINSWWNHGDTGESNRLTMKDIYAQLLEMEPTVREKSLSDIEETLHGVEELFQDKDLTPEERNYLRKFAFCTGLSMDIYVKKQMLEAIIDDMREE